MNIDVEIDVHSNRIMPIALPVHTYEKLVFPHIEFDMNQITL